MMARLMAIRPLTTVTLFALFTICFGKVHCPCGWQLADQPELYTNRLYDDFSQYPSASDLTSNPKVKQFSEQWLVNGFMLPTADPTAAHDQQFLADSVSISDDYLQLTQIGYSAADAAANNPVKIAGIQTKSLDILHGSFRITFKITGDSGGSVGSFFWYHNDTSEIDIEIVTASNSIVNSTINYTSHPSLYPNGTRIPNATLSVPFHTYNVFHTHRFDCTPQTATYYLNNQPTHQDHHNIPHFPGSLQLNLWADGNKLWSGTPSTSNVTMSVKDIDVYYNTSSDSDPQIATNWLATCDKAGGPSNDTICMEGQTTPIASAIASATSAGAGSGGPINPTTSANQGTSSSSSSSSKKQNTAPALTRPPPLSGLSALLALLLAVTCIDLFPSLEI